jgi:hypothetical protein
LGGSFIKCGLLGMIHVTCGTLEGLIVCICKNFPGERYSMEELCHYDLQRGLKTPRMDVIPHRIGRGPLSSFSHEVMNGAFRGTLTSLEDDIISLYTWMLAFGGPGSHLISP